MLKAADDIFVYLKYSEIVKALTVVRFHLWSGNAIKKRY